jgi:hypothetical protein
MRSLCEINRVGINLHVMLKLRPETPGRVWLLIVVNIAFIALWVLTVMFMGDERSDGELLVGFLLSLLLWVFTLGRYTLWHLFGEEYVVINRKSISYQYRYGVFQTHIQTISLHRPVMYYELTQQPQTDGSLGVFHVINHDPDTLLPREVFRSTIPVNERSLQAVIQSVSSLRVNDFCEEHSFPGLSMN